MTDRDQFAAAALTGLTTMTPGGVYPLDDLAQQAYATADAMLRERERTFDAKPRELSDDQRTLRNAADLLGPGGFKNLANELLSLSRRLPDAYAKDCKKCNFSHTGRGAADRPEPITDAESDRPQSIATGATPALHATPGEGSVQGDGSVRDSRTENEPVAWGVMRVGGRWVSILNSAAQAETSRAPFDKMENWVHEVIPLYRHPPCQDFSQKNFTLTHAERDAVETAALEADAHQHTERAATLRGLLERLK